MLGLLGLSDDEFAQRIFSRCGVQRRSLTLTDEFLATTVQGRTPAIEEHLLGYAVRAIDELEVDPLEIGVVVSATLYSLGGPRSPTGSWTTTRWTRPPTSTISLALDVPALCR